MTSESAEILSTTARVHTAGSYGAYTGMAGRPARESVALIETATEDHEAEKNQRASSAFRFQQCENKMQCSGSV